MQPEKFGTHQKALRINLDAHKYGTFAEIGAGQEVGRWFFRVGGASGTVAKTISAYDMTVSDAIYGKCDRYVSRQRLQTMLNYEYGLLHERLSEKRGANTTFFVYADTVAASGYKRQDDANGWMGIKFQLKPGAEPSQILIHVRMLDRENLQQQEALGILGVNLIHGAFFHYNDNFIATLLDDLSSARVEVDMIKFSGPDFRMVDNRLMALELVRTGLAGAAMFTADGEAVQAAEVLYKKPILVERGSFRPVTNVTVDMLDKAHAQFVQEPDVQGEPVVTLMEMTLKNLTEGDSIDYQDFLDRADILGALGKTVLISNYGEHHRLASYLFRYTKRKVGLAMGVPTLREIFDEKYYTDLEGGILESFGRLFKNSLTLYVYPHRDPLTGALTTVENLVVAPHLRHLYAHLLENNCVQSVRDIDTNCLAIFSRDVLAKLRQGDASWENAVPPQVAKLIRERKLLGWQAEAAKG